MTFYEMNAERAPITGGFLANFRQRMKNGVRAMQYGRMMQAMAQLSDEHLETIGLTRADIPRHAHKCVFGDEA